MRRREFLKTGIQAAAASAAVSVPAASSSAAPATLAAAQTPAILTSYTAEDHRRRLENIAVCQRGIRSCMRKHMVTDYLPAQCCYNLGEYPCRKPWDACEIDEKELDQLQAHGIQLIQVMDEWVDALRLCGGTKLNTFNPDGFRRFVKMVHQRGMKLIVYASSGYFIRSDPDFREEWSCAGDGFFGGYWNMVRCSPASPGWRAYLLPRMMRMLEEFEVDGLYNDWGYVPNATKTQKEPAKDEVIAFEETPTYDGALADLLQLIYAEVKRRGGIYKVHADYANMPQTGGAKVYDYLWVGENVDNADGLRKAVRNHSPYVVPCIDMSFASVEDPDEPYLQAIPYLQFPLLLGGWPFTGERAIIPGVPYAPSPEDFWRKRCLVAWEYYQAHSNGPYAYGFWDSIPPRADTRPTNAKWLKQYMPLAEEGTWAWLEIGESSLFARPLPSDVVASAFANRDIYVVLANYGQTPQQIETADAYASVADPSLPPAKHWTLEKRSLKILRRTV